MIHKSFVLIKKGDPFFPTDLTLRCKLYAAQLEKLLLFTFTEEFFFPLTKTAQNMRIYSL